MAILARVLMLVACVPLLQPTGFCVCKAAGPSRTSSPAQEPAEARTPSPTPSPKAGCCSHRNPNADANKTASSDPDRPAPCPAPADDDHHLPGCPASVGVDRFKWVEPAESFAQNVLTLEVVAFLPLEVVLPVAVNPIPPAANWPSSPPLYLSHCALVI